MDCGRELKEKGERENGFGGRLEFVRVSSQKWGDFKSILTKEKKTKATKQ